MHDYWTIVDTTVGTGRFKKFIIIPCYPVLGTNDVWLVDLGLSRELTVPRVPRYVWKDETKAKDDLASMSHRERILAVSGLSPEIID